MARTTIAYLERRYLTLEKEIENALHNSPTDDLAIADLKYRKLIIAMRFNIIVVLQNVLRKSRAVFTKRSSTA